MHSRALSHSHICAAGRLRRDLRALAFARVASALHAHHLPPARARTTRTRSATPRGARGRRRATSRRRRRRSGWATDSARDIKNNATCSERDRPTRPPSIDTRRPPAPATSCSTCYLLHGRDNRHLPRHTGDTPHDHDASRTRAARATTRHAGTRHARAREEEAADERNPPHHRGGPRVPKTRRGVIILGLSSSSHAKEEEEERKKASCPTTSPRHLRHHAFCSRGVPWR